MLAVTSYGRLFFRAIANSLTQSEFEYVPVSYPLSRRAIQSFSYSSPGMNTRYKKICFVLFIILVLKFQTKGDVL